MENGTQPTICPVVPWTFKKAKQSTCYAENEAFELHKWTGISSHSFLSLRFTMFGVCCSQLFSTKSADCETKPAARASVGQSPRQGWTFLTALSQSGSPASSFSCPGYTDLLTIHNWKCRFDGTYDGSLPVQFFYVPVFISSFPLYLSQTHFIAVVQSQSASAFKHWQVHVPPAWWNSLPHKSDNQSLKTAPKRSVKFSQFWHLQI